MLIRLPSAARVLRVVCAVARYSAQLSGVDQSKGALFCIDLAFTISSASSEPLTQLKGTMLASPALKRLRQKLGQ